MRIAKADIVNDITSIIQFDEDETKDTPVIAMTCQEQLFEVNLSSKEKKS